MIYIEGYLCLCVYVSIHSPHLPFSRIIQFSVVVNIRLVQSDAICILSHIPFDNDEIGTEHQPIDIFVAYIIDNKLTMSYKHNLVHKSIWKCCNLCSWCNVFFDLFKFLFFIFSFSNVKKNRQIYGKATNHWALMVDCHVYRMFWILCITNQCDFDILSI